MLEQRSLKLDLAALALSALTVFLAISLATYNPADPPSSLVHPPHPKATNACGRSGALAADVLFSGLGGGAFYLVLSLGVLAGLLLARKHVTDPFLRGLGWLLSLIGLTTLAAMVLPHWSPGPVIGAGGYLGATGRGFLEMHFASVGAYILTLSVLFGGLLLSTEYFLLRIAFRLIGGPLGGLAATRNKLILATARSSNIAPTTDAAGAAVADKSRRKGVIKLEETEAESPPPAVRIGGKQSVSDLENARQELAKDVATSEKAKVADETVEDDDEEEEEKEEIEDAEEEEEKPVAVPAISSGKPAEKKPEAESEDALRIIKKPKSERDVVMQELDAASRGEEARDYELPSIDLLLQGEEICFEEHEKDVRRKAKILEKTFLNFGFKVKVVEIETGPVIAQFEVELEAGLRLSKITSLADDIAIALRVPSVRIVAPIPGKNTVGIEVPNAERQLVRLREVIEESNAKSQKMRIPIYLGKDVSGKSMVVDLTTLPHLLIAGRTGTGKSVCLNTLIVSILMTRRPDEVRMLMIDPKMVELSCYKKLPHLMHPVVTDMRKAEAILAWAVDKMEERYALLARAGVRHISGYNQLGEEELMDRLQPENDEERKNIPTHLPYIVIVADEMADLMMTAAKEVEQHIIRLAQKSRAVGIHLVLATQKPTVDVITGLIKSNLPARIAFQVASRTDSRVVLDEMGADKLLGNGDMLFLWPGTSTLLRGQGTYVSDEEINAVVDCVGKHEPQFVKELVQLKAPDVAGEAAGKLPNRDELYEAAVDMVVREGRGSVSLLQRALGIGYGRAARLVDYMAEDGIVGQYNGSQAREVLLSVEQWEAMQSGGATAGKPASPPKPAKAPITPQPTRKPTPVIKHEADDEDADEEEDFDEPKAAPAPKPKRRVAPVVDEDDADDDHADEDPFAEVDSEFEDEIDDNSELEDEAEEDSELDDADDSELEAEADDDLADNAFGDDEKDFDDEDNPPFDGGKKKTPPPLGRKKSRSA